MNIAVTSKALRRELAEEIKAVVEKVSKPILYKDIERAIGKQPGYALALSLIDAIKAGMVVYLAPRGHGANQPFKLRDFQNELIEGAFAPRIRTGVISIPRANGKTMLAAA